MAVLFFLWPCILVLKLTCLMFLLAAFKHLLLALTFPPFEIHLLIHCLGLLNWKPVTFLATLPCSLGSNNKRKVGFFLSGSVKKKKKITITFTACLDAEDTRQDFLQYIQTTIPPTALGTSVHSNAHTLRRALIAGKVLPDTMLLLQRQKMMLGHQSLLSIIGPNPHKEVSPLVSRCQAEEFGPNLLTALISS